MRFRHLPSPALLFAWLIVVFWNPSSNADEPGATLPDRVEFNRDIRPLLADRCFACHGPDKNKREADLRLDTREGLVGDATANDAAKSGAVKPGEPDASPLLQRIMSTNPDERMPPPAFGKDVSPEEQALLRRWIEQGAVWEGHWAFQPIRSSPSPNVDDPRFRRNFIDRYIRAELNRQGLEPSPREQPHTLVRRLSFDLLGLPPEQALVEKYSANPTDEAYEQLVDELLSSPHFGERMAVWWLDLVRYADSVGYHGDQPISVGPFRDYVIRSFNQNKPFDQFTIEQIAGDLLPESSEELQIAAGYNRLGMMSAEGGVQPKEYLAKYIAERVRNVSGAWLGVTYGCCECHDHKYDPFTSREFYQLEAFFADIQEQGLYDGNKPAEPFGPEMQVPSDEQRKQKEELVQKLAQVQQLLDTPTESLAQSQRTWEEQQLPWVLLKPEKVESLHKVKLEVQSDGSVLASGKNPDTDTYTVTIAQPPAGITAIRLEVLPHDSLPQKGPGRAGNGNFVLSEIELYRLTKASDLPASRRPMSQPQHRPL